MFNGRKREESERRIESSKWSELDVKDFQILRAIPLHIPEALIAEALTYAAATVDAELAELEIDEPSNVQRILYRRAVFARAKAELLPEFSTMAARDLHEKREYVNEQKMLLAEATQAIRAIKGKPRSGVHFI